MANLDVDLEYWLGKLVLTLRTDRGSVEARLDKLHGELHVPMGALAAELVSEPAVRSIEKYRWNALNASRPLSKRSYWQLTAAA
ncbi:MAG: hypothetical protein V4723_07305 [Pseudomonadota bacterium]